MDILTPVLSSFEACLCHNDFFSIFSFSNNWQLTLILREIWPRVAEFCCFLDHGVIHEEKASAHLEPWLDVSKRSIEADLGIELCRLAHLPDLMWRPHSSSKQAARTSDGNGDIAGRFAILIAKETYQALSSQVLEWFCWIRWIKTSKRASKQGNKDDHASTQKGSCQEKSRTIKV